MEHEANGLILIFLGEASACRQDGSLHLLSAAASDRLSTRSGTVQTDKPCLLDGACEWQPGSHIHLRLGCVLWGGTVSDRQVWDWVGDQAAVGGSVWPPPEQVGGQSAERAIGVGNEE